MVRRFATLISLATFTLNLFCASAEIVEMRFEAELIKAVPSDAPSMIEGSFFYNDDEIHRNVKALTIRTDVEIKDFSLSANGLTQNYGGGLLKLEESRFPKIEIPLSVDYGKFYNASLIVGESKPFGEVNEPHPIVQMLAFDPVLEFKAATGLNPDDSISKQDLYQLAQADTLTIEQDLTCVDDNSNLRPCYINIHPLKLLELIDNLELALLFELTSIDTPLIAANFSDGSANGSTEISSRLTEYEQSFLWTFGEVELGALFSALNPIPPLPPYTSQNSYSSGLPDSSLTGWEQDAKYIISQFTVVESIPEPSSVALFLICLSLISASHVGVRYSHRIEKQNY